MPKKINAKTKVTAVKDYLTSGEPLRAVAERNGISTETLRRFLGNKVRKKGSRSASKGVMSIPFPQSGKKTRAKKDTTKPNSNLRWKKAEDELLRDAVIADFTAEETMEILGRTKAGILTRKHHLMQIGFIDEKRFKTPEGITRARRRIEDHTAATAQTASIQTTVLPVPAKEEKPVSKTVDPASEAPSLRELAALVREFGVSVNMTVTAEGTVINMHN